MIVKPIRLGRALTASKAKVAPIEEMKKAEAKALDSLLYSFFAVVIFVLR
jgi:hypothetical protein